MLKRNNPVIPSNMPGVSFDPKTGIATTAAAISAEQVARIFGCSTEQVIAQYKENAADLHRMAQKATASGKKVNGATAEELSLRAELMASKTI